MAMSWMALPEPEKADSRIHAKGTLFPLTYFAPDQSLAQLLELSEAPRSEAGWPAVSKQGQFWASQDWGMLLAEPRYVSDRTEVTRICGITTKEEFFNELTVFSQFWLNF